MEITYASASRRRPAANRRPLGDLTNSVGGNFGGYVSLSSSDAPLGSYSLRSGLKNDPRKKPASKLDEVSLQPSSTGSGGVEEGPREKEAERIPKSSEALPREKENSKVSVGNAQQSTERRKRKKRKEVTVMGHSSCPPVGRTRNMGYVGDKVETKREGIFEPKSCMIPLLKPKKRKLHKTPVVNPELDQDLMKQRAYFAEIDTDELIEEVASDSELD